MLHSRAMQQTVQKFGFRLQYNRLYKPEYLPGRVKYNQFFFWTILGVWYGTYGRKVSLEITALRSWFNLTVLVFLDVAIH